VDKAELSIPRIERSKAIKTALADEDRAKLVTMVQSGGYAVLQRLMEAACILQDATLVAVEVDNTAKIVAEQHIAVAKWEFFDFIQKQVEAECNRQLNPERPDLRTEEEIEAQNVLNP
jgi:hypothetical protein